MAFKQLVMAKYQIVETEEEVTAGFKEILKKAGLFLTGVAMLAESAMGFTFKPEKLRIYESDMKKVMTKYEESISGEAKYDFKIDTQQTGGVQKVDFKIMKNGKLAGIVHFIGTESDVYNDYKAGPTKIGEDDEWVRYVLDSQVKMLEHKFQQSMEKD